MIRVEDCTPARIEEAQAIAGETYAEARGIVPALPETQVPSLAEFVKNDMGVAACRGGGLYVHLLNAALKDCAARGVRSLGVDYESVNPAAYAFWTKHFTPYTLSVTRRIDEAGLA